MAQLTCYIFVWDENDLLQLRAARWVEREASPMLPKEADLTCPITKAEMLLHCGRTIQVSKEMEVKEMIEAYDRERGCNTL